MPAGSRAPSADGGTYTVARGDSWYWIAERAGTSVRALLAANGASGGEMLHPGEQIRLPAGVAPPASDVTASGRITLEALPTQGPCWYSDSWGHPRSGGRKHVGVDIFTVPGEYVYAVADGRLTLRKWAQPGNISGNAWRLTADDGTAYFYAHLSDFAPGLSTGSRVDAGQIIGWIGKTGNTTVDHLHFEIRPGGGSPVNPYPILQSQGGGCNRGTPLSSAPEPGWRMTFWAHQASDTAGLLTGAVRGTIVTMTTDSLRNVKDRFSEFVDRVDREHERVVVTRNGRPAAVLISPDDLESLEETLAILGDTEAVKALAEAEAAVAAGDVVRGVDAVRSLRPVST
jgi:prevent-host-death family protein